MSSVLAVKVPVNCELREVLAPATTLTESQQVTMGIDVKMLRSFISKQIFTAFWVCGVLGTVRAPCFSCVLGVNESIIAAAVVLPLGLHHLWAHSVVLGLNFVGYLQRLIKRYWLDWELPLGSYWAQGTNQSSHICWLQRREWCLQIPVCSSQKLCQRCRIHCRMRTSDSPVKFCCSKWQWMLSTCQWRRCWWSPSVWPI